MEVMLKQALEYLNSLTKPITIDVDGKPFYDKKYYPAEDIYPATLQINNLTGIVDYLSKKPEEWDDLFIHVVDFDNVVLYQVKTGPFNQREPIIFSTARPCQFQFEAKIDIEDFIISLRSLFIHNDDREYLLKFLSGVKLDSNTTVEDDGVSQKVTARQGMSSLVSEISIKPFVCLLPFRTFNEIAQPESEFVFRMGSKSDNKPQASLHECDGGIWKQKAVASIKDWFIAQGVNIPIIA